MLGGGDLMPKNIFVGVGISKDNDPFKAGKEAVSQAVTKMREQSEADPNFGVVFCSGGKYGKNTKTIQKLVNGVHSVLSRYNECKWIGCTTAGEIFQEKVEHGSVVAMVISSKFIKCGVGIGENLSENPVEAGRKAAHQALNDLKMDKYVDAYISYLSTKASKPSELIKQRQFAILTLPAGLTIKKSGWEDSMLDGIKEVVGNTPIIGGSAGDDLRFIKTYQFANGKVYEDSVVLSVIFSNLKLGFGLMHGFEPTDKIALVTKAKGNVVYELNHRPAAEVYAEMIGVSKKELLKGSGLMANKSGNLKLRAIKFAESVGITPKLLLKRLPFYKFAIESPFGIPDISGNYLAKGPKCIIQDKYIEFYNRVPVNMPLTLLTMNEEKTAMVESLAIKKSVEEVGKPALMLIFDCIVRYAYLEDRLNKVYKRIESETKDIPKIGFYTYGEQGFMKNMLAGHHAYTCVVLCIGDKLITQK